MSAAGGGSLPRPRAALSSGTFPPDTTYGAGNGPTSVAIADLDGQNGLDLAVANGDTAGTVSVLLNNGNGTFATQPNPPDAGLLPASVAIGDLDGQNRLDLAVAIGNDGGRVAVLLNNGGGTFLQNNPTYGVDFDPRSVAIGDLNGDDILDLAAANFGSANVSVLLGQQTP